MRYKFRWRYYKNTIKKKKGFFLVLKSYLKNVVFLDKKKPKITNLKFYKVL